MTDLDKFYSDADKIISRAYSAQQPHETKKLAQELVRHFLIWSRDYQELSGSLSEYFTRKYEPSLATEAGRKAAVEWFASLLALFTGTFEAGMDFPDDDWAEIRDTINAEAEELDIELLSSLLTVIVERGKA